MPKRDIADFIAHWKDATASEQSISQQFLCELCDLLDVPQPGNQRNGAYTFEFHVRETQHAFYRFPLPGAKLVEAELLSKDFQGIGRHGTEIIPACNRYARQLDIEALLPKDTRI